MMPFLPISIQRRFPLGLSCFALLVMLIVAFPAAALSYQTQEIKYKDETFSARLPQGYRLTLLTAALSGPRLFSFLPNGDLLIGSKSGHVYRLPPPYTTPPQSLVRLDDYPHSVAYRQGELWIAQTEGLYRAPYQPGQSRIDAKAVQRVAPLPEGGHNSRTVAVGPDQRIYVSIGISGNCSDEYLDAAYPFELRRGGIFVLNESGPKPQLETFASGLRNPVGFDWHPQTREMYVSNNGPDHLGFELPPEYFSKVLPGSFHGMPWFQYDGQSIRRDPCISRASPRPLKDVPVPVATFPARNAPMGVVFVPAGALEPGLAFNAIVALRGSWGTPPDGSGAGHPATRRPPKIVLVRFHNASAQRVEDLITGFQLPNGSRWARPVGVGIGPDGALYFTSDEGIQGLFRLERVAR